MGLRLRSQDCFARFSFLWSDDFTRATLCLDLRSGRSAESMRAHRQLARQFTVTQNFHAAGRAVGESSSAQSGFIHSRTIFELIESIEIHRNITRRMTCVIEAALGNTANQRHLSAFKPDSNRTAGAGRLSFAAAPAGLAMAAGFSLAEPLPAMLRTRTRFKIV